jgi:uncharacterized protein YdeI (YjbR/CyaY-like superfamily)
MSEVAANGYPILAFKAQTDWEKWLDKNCLSSNGVWIMFAKKNSDETTINYQQALEEALRYGWIDSQAKTYDEKFYLQKFTPRRARSIWSKINVEKIEALVVAAKMKPSGLAQVEAAKADGRWEAAYGSPSATQMQDYFLEALEKNKKAKDFFETISRANKYAIAWRLHQAKRPETKERLTKKFIDMLSEGKTIH